MNTEPVTLEQVNKALSTLTVLMAECDDHPQMEIFSTLFTTAYMLKLRLTKENPHARH
jgi:hypothetical protein